MILAPPFPACLREESMAKLTFGDRLKMVRERRELTQEELAVLIGSTQKNISKYENGTIGLPREPVIMKLAEVLNVSPGWLAFGHAELDELDEAAIQFAIDWSKLSKEQQEVFRKLMDLHTNRAEGKGDTAE